MGSCCWSVSPSAGLAQVGRLAWRKMSVSLSHFHVHVFCLRTIDSMHGLYTFQVLFITFLFWLWYSRTQFSLICRTLTVLLLYSSWSVSRFVSLTGHSPELALTAVRVLYWVSRSHRAAKEMVAAITSDKVHV